jgi:hypothetical protein
MEMEMQMEMEMEMETMSADRPLLQIAHFCKSPTSKTEQNRVEKLQIRHGIEQNKNKNKNQNQNRTEQSRTEQNRSEQ